MKTFEEYFPGIEYQELFNHLSEHHDLTCTQSEMDEIINITKKFNQKQAVEVALRVASEKVSNIVCSTTGERLGSEYILSLLPEIIEELNNGK